MPASPTVTGPDLSIVIPFHNEEAAAALLLEELRDVVQQHGWNAEIILIDDGSRDGTAAALDRVASEWAACRVSHFRDNRGQAAALWHGLREARAPLVATLDGDGQSVPADLARLLPLLNSADLIVGIRQRRLDGRLRSGMSAVANRVRARVLGDGLHDGGCAVKVMRREVIDSFIPIRTLYSFMPAMARAAGWRLAEAPVSHRPRRGGVSHYGLIVMSWRPFVDMLALRWLWRQSRPFGRSRARAWRRRQCAAPRSRPRS